MFRGVKARKYIETVAIDEYKKYRDRVKKETLLSDGDVIKNASILTSVMLLTRGKELNMLMENVYANMSCVLLDNRTSMDFITSDEPAQVIGKNKNDVGLFRVPLDDMSAKVFLPIGPKRAVLLIRDPASEELDGTFVDLSGKDLNYVKSMNEVQFKYCNYVAIAKDKELLE